VQIDLVGGYYDAGDNLKLGFPMAFTITMLSWSTIEFKDKLQEKNELENALSAIKWGTDYLMKAHQQPNSLYGEIGDPDSDHQCWERPEDMDTPRTSYKIDEQHPGSDLAAETAAALAAASIVFQSVDNKYASTMLIHAIHVCFDFVSCLFFLHRRFVENSHTKSRGIRVQTTVITFGLSILAFLTVGLELWTFCVMPLLWYMN
jgi:hypothetical protein